MKRKYKLLLSSIGLLSISTITLASVISCSDGSNNSKEKTSSSSNSSKNDDNSKKSRNNSNSSKNNSASNNNQSNITTPSALATYFSNSNNQIALIRYLLQNDYIIYNNGEWNYNTSTSVNNSNGYTSWDDALSDGISAFINNNQNVSYDGISGLEIYDISVASASYSATSGLVFNVTHTGTSASSSVTISTSTLNNYMNGTNNVANPLTTYFNNENNQIALINYLLNNDYITYNNGAWNYNTSKSANYGNGYTGWDDALSDGISAFINNNQNVSYDGVFGFNLNVGQHDDITDHYISTNLSVTSASYSSENGLVFSIAYNGVSASSSNVTISDGTLNNYNNTTNLSNIVILNALTSYFGNENNQVALINYGNTWWWDSGTTDWDDALSDGISAFIANNQNISYDGVLGSNININDLSVTSASYSAASGFTFTITYDNLGASNAITISETTMNNDNENTNLSNAEIANALTAYFKNANNQIALISYLSNNKYITYSYWTWNNNPNSSAPNGSGYTSWTSALSSGISAFIANNQNISYDGVLGSSLNVGQYIVDSNGYAPIDLLVTSASYNSAENGLVFSIAYDNISAIGTITISTNTLNKYINTNINVANGLTNYFSNSNNKKALINFLVDNDYITYSNDKWSYNKSSSSAPNYIGYTSWTTALSSGISDFISGNQNISYDGVLGSNINAGQNYIRITNSFTTNEISISSASYSINGGIVFTIAYNGISASSYVTISTSSLNQCNKDINSSEIAIPNALTTYFSDSNNQIALINYLVNNYITYTNDGTWSYYTSYYSWANALSSGISAFIDANQSVWYDGVLGLSLYIGFYNSESEDWKLGYLSVTGASYSASSGLVFNITYDGSSASSSVTISTNTLNNYIISNDLTNYFSISNNNQMTLINFLLDNGYITYSNDKWSYNKSSSSAPNYIGYTSWNSALSSGISDFISNNQNISYDGVLGSSINTNDLSVTNAWYDSADGWFTFSIAYNNISAGYGVSISTTTLNQFKY